MKSFKIIVKNQTKAEQKASLLFWFLFFASVVIVTVVMFYYYQNTIKAIDASASSEMIVNQRAIR